MMQQKIWPMKQEDIANFRSDPVRKAENLLFPAIGNALCFVVP